MIVAGNIGEADFMKICALVGDYVSEMQRQVDEFTRYRAAGPAPAGS